MKFKSNLLSVSSGSLNGTTASRAAGGVQYLRNRSTGVNPNSPRQQAIRAVLGALSVRWQVTLTDAQRAAWLAYGTAVPNTGVFGDPVPLSSQQAYIRGNSARMQAKDAGLTIGTAPVDAGPLEFNRGANPLPPSTFEQDAGVITLSGDLGSAANTDGDILLYIGPALPEGSNYFKGPYQLAATAAIAAAATTYNMTPDTADAAEWAAGYIPVNDQRIPLKLVVVYDDGRVSQTWEGIVRLASGA